MNDEQKSRRRMMGVEPPVERNGKVNESDHRRARPSVPTRDDVTQAPGEMGRRAAMKLMAASSLLASGAIGCRRKPHRKIVSMVDPPEFQEPGIPVYYASTWTDGQIPYGMMVKTVDGRPIKIEGLGGHPLNQGTSSAQMQASILSLYDPDRLQGPRAHGKPAKWNAVDRQVVAAIRGAKRVVLVSRASLGPSERSLVKRFLAACPDARHFASETVHDQSRRTAWQAVFGADGQLVPQLDKAKIIVSLDADFLGTDGDVLGQTCAFAARRRLTGNQEVADLSRLYVFESTMTVTGSNADHRCPVKPSVMGPLLAALDAAVAGSNNNLATAARAAGVDERVLVALVKDLKTHRGEVVVLAGTHLPAPIHAVVAVLNSALDAFGKTLQWNPDPSCLEVTPTAKIRDTLLAGAPVDVLIFLGANPGHDWPHEDFQTLIERAGCTIGMGMYDDETLAACTYALPTTHNLESWNDAAPAPGVTTLCQPVIAPLFDARQDMESLLVWAKALAADDTDLAACADWHGYIKRRWGKEVLGGTGATPQRTWEDALRRGMVSHAAETRPAVPKINQTAAAVLLEQAALLEAAAMAEPRASDGFELVILPHHSVFDGRFATNAWLRELPDPVSKLVWENAATLSPNTAKQLGVAENDKVSITARGPGGTPTQVVFPVLVQSGQADGVVAVTLGHGRALADVTGAPGVNAAPLLGAAEPVGTDRLRFGVAVALASKGPADRAARLVRTQKTFSMMGRPIVLQGTAGEYEKDPDFVKTRKHVPPLEQIDAPYDYSKGHKWAMAIDQSACTGCSACVIACQAENNIPVVGKEECGHGREMHWMRIDRYEVGSPDNPDIYQQPMLCQQCDNAPCESVCPVNATSHSPEGLNDQAYNRCVGTRYCANNCPYKVRRFNFFNYQGRVLKDSVQELVFNPQVTVRSRGIMEKCTFCVQRINAGKFQSVNAGTPLPDGLIQPACQQSCPAQAIVFGDVNDPDSRIATMHASSLAYFVLEELNVRPNVAYLARVKNPHPDLAAKPEGGHG